MKRPALALGLVVLLASATGAAAAGSKAPEAARALIAFLKTPQAVKVMRAQGMEPLF